MTELLLIALATFASEDLTCIATGVLIAQGRMGFVPGVLVGERWQRWAEAQLMSCR